MNILSISKLPSELGNLRSLVEMFLHQNSLTGQVPSEFGNSQSLLYMFLNQNSLTGQVSSELGKLHRLSEVMSLVQNSLNGQVPSEFGNILDILSDLPQGPKSFVHVSARVAFQK